MNDKKPINLDSIHSSDRETRLDTYKAIGFNKEALEDEHWPIRLEAYRALGFTENAFTDIDWEIRLEAYKKLGFTHESRNDDHWLIRSTAEEYFGVDPEDDEIIEPIVKEKTPISLTGRKYYKLRVSGFSKVANAWLCICICSNPTTVTSSNLMSGKVRSCGCGGVPTKEKCTMKKNGVFIA